MEQLESNRFKTDTIKRGRVIYSNDISINKISNTEISFETSLYIFTNSINKIELVNKNNEKIKLAGEAISSLLIGTKKANGDNIPIFNVCLKFIQLSDVEKQFLDKLSSEHTNMPAGK